VLVGALAFAPATAAAGGHLGSTATQAVGGGLKTTFNAFSGANAEALWGQVRDLGVGTANVVTDTYEMAVK